jgi:uncharacterized protein YuzE
MRLSYYAETDSLYVEFRDALSADSREIAPGVVVDFDEKGNVVGIHIDHASEKLDISTLETTAFPTTSTRIASAG